MIVRLTELAQRDLQHSIYHYESESTNLGTKFYRRYLVAVEDLCFIPRTGRVIEADIHKLKISGFPFSLFYRVHDDYLEVLRVADLRQDPET